MTPLVVADTRALGRTVRSASAVFAACVLMLGACGGDDDHGSGNGTGDGGPGGGGDGSQVSANKDGGGDPASQEDAAPSDACGKAGAPTGYQKTNALMVAGANRNYSIYVPASYNPMTPYPVVFVLHGDGGTGDNIRSSFTVEPAANDAAIFVYPDGQDQTWDIDSWVSPNKDVPFIDALVTTVASTYCTNKNRFFVTGLSRGAYMANQLGCWRGGIFRAIAPHSGGGPYDATGMNYDNNGNLVCPGTPVPALMIHGDADQTVALSEGMKSLAYWTLADKCQMSTSAAMPSPCLSQNSCTPSPVTFCKIPGLTHMMWSMAPAAIWGFFDSMK